MAKNLATTFAALNNVKKIVDGESPKGSAPKATVNTTSNATAKGVATQKATPTPVIEETPKKSTVQTSKATKPVSKVVNTVEKAKKAVSKYAPTLVELTGAVTPKKETNYGDVIRSAFDKKNANKRNAEIPVLKNDRELINYYENIPNYNALQRLTSFEKNNAYNQKQALTSQYQQAKDRTIPALLNKYGITDEDVNATSVMSSHASNPNKYFESEMRKLGLSDTDIDYLRDYAQRQSRSDINSRLVNSVGKNTASKAVGTIASLPLNPLESLGNVASQGISYLSGKPMTNDNHLTRDIRDVASENLGTGGKFAYDVGTSIGDMATALLLANLTGGGSTLSAGAMGLEKASDVINEGIERNLTPDQIMAEGIASGLTTALTEKIPMGKWDDIAEAGFSGARGLAYAKELGKKIVASAIPEAGQEAAEDLADAIADAIITGDKSQINDNIRMYEQNGLSHDEATAQAWIDFAKQMGMDALAGGISGGVLGGGKSIATDAITRNYLNKMGMDEYDAMVDDAANRLSESLGINSNSSADSLDLSNYEGMTFVPGDYKDAIKNGEISKKEVLAKTTPAFQNVLNRLSNNEDVSLEEITSLPEMQYARNRVIPVDKENNLPDSWDKYKANPTPEREALHNDLANWYYSQGSARFDKNGKPIYDGDVKREKKIFFVTGLPASGKSSTLVDKISNKYGARILDSDEIKFKHPEFDNGFGGNYIHEECKNILKMVTDKAKSNDENLVVPIIGGGDPSELAKKIKKYQDNGWEVSLTQNDLPSKKAIGRALTRYITDGRYIPPEVLFNYGETPGINYEQMTRKGVDYKLNELAGFARVDNDVPERTDAITREYAGRLAELFGNPENGMERPDGEVVLGERSGERVGLPIISEKQPQNGAAFFDNEQVADRVMQSMFNSGNAEMNRNANNLYSNPLVPLESVQNEQTVNDTIPNLDAPQNGLQSVQNGEVGTATQIPTINIGIEQKNNGKASQVATNSFTNSPTFRLRKASLKWLKENIKAGTFNYDSVTEQQTMDAAVENLSRDLNGEIKRLEGTPKLSAVDIDETMIVLDLLTDEAEKTGDYSKVLFWAKQMQTKVTDMAQGLQALSKYSRTASSTLMKIEKMRDIKAKNLGGKEKAAAQKFSSILERVLAKIGYDGSMVTESDLQKSFGQIYNEVLNTMGKESSSVFDDFNEQDLNYLATLIHNGASEQRLYDALTHKLATGEWDISNEDVKAVVDIFKQIDGLKNRDSKQANELENQAYAIMAKYLGNGDFMEKWNAWRYLAMLGNPRTHIRNMVGNLMFGTLTNIKDNMAGLMESAINPYYKNRGIERQRAFVSRATDGNLLKATAKDFDESSYIPATDNSNKYSMDRDIERHKKIFKNKFIQLLVDKNGKALDAEDTWAIKNKYSRVLASYLKANGYNESILNSDNPKDIKFLERAREFAVEQAKIATFHEDSALANYLNGMSKAARASDNLGVKALGTAIEAVVPFKKTPINILKQGAIEYNPLGQAGKGVHQVIKAVKNHEKLKMNPSDIIDAFCKSLSGSAIAALGYALASKGFLRGSGKDEEDYAQGKQEYSVEWKSKNGKHHSFTLDWAAPSALPLFMGVELYKWYEDSEQDAGSFFDALSSIGAPAFELSMLEGVNDAIKNFGKATNSVTGVMSGVAGLGASYLSQAVPTLGGQIARTIDPTRRSTHTGQEYGGVSDMLVKQGIKAMNKIPGLTYLSQPYVNTFGEEEQNEDLGLGALGRGIQNFLLPGYYSETNADPVVNELSNVVQLAKESGVDFKKSQLFPKAPDKKVDEHRLTPKEYTEASKAKGQITKENLEALFESDSYQNATPEQKVEMIKDMLSTSNQLFKHEQYGKEPENAQKKLGIYEDKGIDGLLTYDNIKSLMDGQNNNAIKIEALNQSNLSDEDLGYFASQLFTKPSADAVAMQERYGDIGLYYWYSIASQSDTKAGKYDAVEQSNFPTDVKESLLEVIGESGKKNKNTSETPTQTTAQTTDRIPTLDEFINAKRTGQPLPEVTTKKSTKSKNADISNMVGSANGKTWVDFGQAVPYLESQGLSASERGQAYWNTGDKSSGKQKVYDDMGYPGVAQYYENQYHADQAGNQDNKKQKAEMKSYLKSLGFSNEDISYWMGVYGWKP